MSNLGFNSFCELPQERKKYILICYVVEISLFISLSYIFIYEKARIDAATMNEDWGCLCVYCVHALEQLKFNEWEHWKQ